MIWTNGHLRRIRPAVCPVDHPCRTAGTGVLCVASLQRRSTKRTPPFSLQVTTSLFSDDSEAIQRSRSCSVSGDGEKRSMSMPRELGVPYHSLPRTPCDSIIFHALRPARRRPRRPRGNIQRSTLNVQQPKFALGCWMLDVGRWIDIQPTARSRQPAANTQPR